MAPLELQACPSRLIVFATIYTFFDIIIRKVSKHFKDPIPSSIVLSGVCLLLGTFLHYIEPYGEDYQGLRRKPVHDLLSTVATIYIFSAIYTMDLFLRHTKTFVAVCIVCATVLVVTTIGLCIVMWYLIGPNWDWIESCLAVLVVMPVQPTHATILLRELGKYRNLATMLEVEAIGTFMAIFAAFEYLRMVQAGTIKTIWQHITFLVRYVSGGCVVGVAVGKLTALMVSPLYNESSSAVSFLLGIAIFTYFACECMLSVSGNIAIIIVSSYLMDVRYKFSNEVDKNVTYFFRVVASSLEVSALCLYITEAVPHLFTYGSDSVMGSSMLLFLTFVLLRTCVFMLFGCCMNSAKFMTLDYDVRTGFILGFSGLKGSFNLMLAFILIIEPATFAIGRVMLVDTLLIYIYSIVINALPLQQVLQVIGFAEFSVALRQNMNFCLKQLMFTRGIIIETLKSYNFLKDANWDRIREVTEIRHPYTRVFINYHNIEASGESVEVFHSSAAICPECFKRVPYDLTEWDIHDLCVEARGKLLKAKKISINKQFEEGAINVNCVQLLLYNIDLLIDEKITHPKLDIRTYLKPHTLLKLRALFNRCKRGHAVPPHQVCKRYLFYLVNYYLYDFALLAAAVAGAIYAIWNISEVMTRESASYHLALIVIFAIDLLLRLAALPRCKDFENSNWIIWSLFCLILESCLLYEAVTRTGEAKRNYSLGCRIAAVCRLSYLYVAKDTLLAIVANAIENRIDSKIAFGFDVAAALASCCDEVLDRIGQKLRMSLIREIYTRDVQDERNFLASELRNIQKQRPEIPVTMKTRQVIRSTLCAMNESLNELKHTGYVDTVEYEFINQMLAERLKVLHSMTKVKPPTPKLIFEEIPWLRDDTQIIEFLYSKAEVVRMEPGHIIMEDGHRAAGIYLILAGTLRLHFKAESVDHTDLETYGHVPIVDYLSTVDFDADIDDDIMPGSTLGEKSILTHRSYNCTIVADSHATAFFLSNEIMQQAFELFNNPVIGLEAKMWKCCNINLAISILRNSKIYKTFTSKEIKIKLNRAFVPSLKCYKLFVVTEWMDDLLLIEGIAKDCHSMEMFHAPLLIPRNTHMLYVSKSESLGVDMETKIMVLPLLGKTEIEIMQREENQAEMVSYTTSSCVLQPVQGSVALSRTHTPHERNEP